MKTACGDQDCNLINSGIDKCIQGLVKSLNENGMETIASCCGHGRTNGNITLKDGREIIIISNYDDSRAIEKFFPDIHGEKSKRSDLHNGK